MSGPERIWACHAAYDGRLMGIHDGEVSGWDEYVRADLLTAAQAEIARLTVERDSAMAGPIREITEADMKNIVAHLSYECDPQGPLPSRNSLMMEVVHLSNRLAAFQPDTERAEPVADVVRGVWGRCEALEDEAYAKLELESDKLTDHEIGFWRGQKLAAKSIRRSTELPQPAPAPQAREITVQEAAEVPCDFLALVFDAMAEANRTMRKFPQPNYVISKLAEEAGETVKAAIHHAEGRETRDAVVGEMRQAIAMMLRLWIEGDEVHGMPALRTPAAMQKGG